MSDYELGQHSAQINALGERIRGLEGSVTGMDKKLDTVLIALAERRGERKTIAAIATVAGGVGSFILTALLKMVGA